LRWHAGRRRRSGARSGRVDEFVGFPYGANLERKPLSRTRKIHSDCAQPNQGGPDRQQRFRRSCPTRGLGSGRKLSVRRDGLSSRNSSRIRCAAGCASAATFAPSSKLVFTISCALVAPAQTAPFPAPRPSFAPASLLRRSCLSLPVILAFSPTQESGKRSASSQSSAIITKASSCLHDGRGQNGSHGCPLPTKLSERIIRMTTIRRAATSQSKLSLSDWLGAYLPR
jgi:hypothetical protein